MLIKIGMVLGGSTEHPRSCFLASLCREQHWGFTLFLLNDSRDSDIVTSLSCHLEDTTRKIGLLLCGVSQLFIWLPLVIPKHQPVGRQSCRNTEYSGLPEALWWAGGVPAPFAAASGSLGSAVVAVVPRAGTVGVRVLEHDWGGLSQPRWGFAWGAEVVPAQTAGKCVGELGMGFPAGDWFHRWSILLGCRGTLPLPGEEPRASSCPAWTGLCRRGQYCHN